MSTQSYGFMLLKFEKLYKDLDFDFYNDLIKDRELSGTGDYKASSLVKEITLTVAFFINPKEKTI